MKNPFENLDSQIAIKRAYRRLCLTCHPDVRNDKERAAEEFRELTKIYEMALASVGKRRVRPKPQPPSPPPKPPKPIQEDVYVPMFESFEFINFGSASRAVYLSPAIFEYGGTVHVHARSPTDGFALKIRLFSFRVPAKTLNGQKFRFQVKEGYVILTLVAGR